MKKVIIKFDENVVVEDFTFRASSDVIGLGYGHVYAFKKEDDAYDADDAIKEYFKHKFGIQGIHTEVVEINGLYFLDLCGFSISGLANHVNTFNIICGEGIADYNEEMESKDHIRIINLKQ